MTSGFAFYTNQVTTTCEWRTAKYKTIAEVNEQVVTHNVTHKVTHNVTHNVIPHHPSTHILNFNFSQVIHLVMKYIMREKAK